MQQTEMSETELEIWFAISDAMVEATATMSDADFILSSIINSGAAPLNADTFGAICPGYEPSYTLALVDELEPEVKPHSSDSKRPQRDALAS